MAAFVNVIDQRRLIGPGGSTVSGQIYFYYTGTDVKAPVYLDVALTIPAPNPTFVGAGEVIPQLFLDGSVIYRRVIEYSDGTTDEVDPIGEVTDEGEFGPPVGSILDFAGDTAPPGFLLCFGQAVSRTEYETLFGVIGTSYGAGNGTTTFNLPDYRGRVLAGKDNMGGFSANRLVDVINGDILGQTGGSEKHVLTETELPSHNHGVTDPGHMHGIADTLRNSGGNGNTSPGGTILAAANTTGNSTTGITIGNTGGGAGHSNIQPTAITNKIIKATPTSYFSFSGGTIGGGSSAIFQPLDITSEGQTVFTVPVAMTVPPLVVINGVIVNADDAYTNTLTTITFNEGLSLADTLLLIIGVGVNQGIVDAGNVIGLSTAVIEILGSRYADVRDIADFDPTGSNDMASGYQELINQAATAGVPVFAPACSILLGSTVSLPGGHNFKGTFGPSFQTTDTAGTVIKRGHSGKLFTKGAGNAGILIENMSIYSNQPTPSGGLWTPADNDYDFYFTDVSDFNANRLTHINSTRGIYMNGNRNKLQNWNGQFFKKGLHVDWSYDTLRVSDVHHWPFWNQSDEVRNYMQANLRSFELHRVDNPMFSRIFSIWPQYGFYIDWYPGEGISRPAGTTYKMKLSEYDHDTGQYAYYVTPAANGHTAKFKSVTAQGRVEVTNAPLLLVEGPNTVITGDFTGDQSGANVCRLSSTSTGSKLAMQVGTNSYNRSGLGFPAVDVESGGGHFDLLPGSIISGGGGAAVSGGDVTVWNP